MLVNKGDEELSSGGSACVAMRGERVLLYCVQPDGRSRLTRALRSTIVAPSSWARADAWPARGQQWGAAPSGDARASALGRAMWRPAAASREARAAV